jgi:hypothetical protein
LQSKFTHKVAQNVSNHREKYPVFLEISPSPEKGRDKEEGRKAGET